MIVYALIDPRNLEIRYIGQTINMHKRFIQHLCNASGRKTHVNSWIKSLKKEKLKPEIYVLEECFSLEDLNQKEEFYINYFRFIGANLTNHKSGGLRPKVFNKKPHTEEFKKFMSEKQKNRMKDPEIYKIAINNLRKPDEKTKEKIRNTLMGTKRPIEVIEKMRKSMLGKKATDETKKKLSKSVKNKKSVICNETDQFFESIDDAARYFNGCRSQLSEHLSGKRNINTFKGHTFSYSTNK